MYNKLVLVFTIVALCIMAGVIIYFTQFRKKNNETQEEAAEAEGGYKMYVKKVPEQSLL